MVALCLPLAALTKEWTCEENIKAYIIHHSSLIRQNGADTLKEVLEDKQIPEEKIDQALSAYKARLDAFIQTAAELTCKDLSLEKSIELRKSITSEDSTEAETETDSAKEELKRKLEEVLDTSEADGEPASPSEG